MRYVDTINLYIGAVEMGMKWGKLEVKYKKEWEIDDIRMMEVVARIIMDKCSMRMDEKMEVNRIKIYHNEICRY